jgi:hypothetical protein
MLYDELRELAAAKLRREKPGQTLQATALGTRSLPAAYGGRKPGLLGFSAALFRVSSRGDATHSDGQYSANSAVSGESTYLQLPTDALSLYLTAACEFSVFGGTREPTRQPSCLSQRRLFQLYRIC